MAGNRMWAWAALPILLVAALLVGAPQLWPAWRAYTFLLVLLLLAGELALVGWLVNGRLAGVFIDNRNRLSLSKLQAGAWTVVVLSAFATAAAFNAVGPGSDPATVTALAIQIPGELLLAMGISATSLVATPSLLSLKAAEDPSAAAVQGAQARTGAAPLSNGKVFLRASTAEASWGDLVTGDEVGNAGAPDLGKIQQALITLLLLGCYVGYAFQLFAKGATPLHELPMLDKSFVWLMGISHASYLAYKAAPHTETAPATGAGA